MFSSKVSHDTSYKYGFFKSILDSLYNADENLVLTFDHLFYKFAEIYWNLVLKYNLRQKAKTKDGRETSLERVLKEALQLTSDGIISTKQVEDAGISRTILKILVEEGILDKESRGIYSLADYFADEYKIIQMRSDKAIFSYWTALHLLGLSNRIPNNFDVSVPQGCNVSRIKKDNPTLRLHYVKREWWNIGITSIRTPFGASVSLYNKERCICDLIRNKNDVDLQLFTQVLKDYFKKKCDVRLLSEYGALFGIDEKIRTYVEVLY